MNRRLTQRGEERRDQLIRTAAGLFAARGYHGTSVSDIVSECKVGKGVFYWYFPSKESLFTAILDVGFHNLRRAQQKAIEGEIDPVARVVRGIRATIEFLAGNVELFRLFELAAVDKDHAAQYEAAVETAVEDTNRHLTEAISRGLLPDRDPHYMAHGITTITMNFFRQFMALDAPERRARQDEVIEAAVDFCLNGIHAAEGAKRAVDAARSPASA
ncbi:MAG: TetR/AcrR family transcriptional regulator [Acidimicrobiia bacterium]|nr:TetR/AcrR family transcriptional regulator [Acidimicrobiia bacterium]